MADYFALLHEPRRPWIDPDQLKDKFLAYAKEAHPDRVHGSSPEDKRAAHQRSAELNAAYRCLREPKERVLHLLELELGSKPKEIERLPSHWTDLFLKVGQMCRAVDALSAESAKVTSPLLKVQWLEKGLEWMEKLNGLQATIQNQKQQTLDEFKALNSIWESAPEVGSPSRRASLPLDRLEQSYRTLRYLSRWAEQIQARIVRLSR